MAKTARNRATYGSTAAGRAVRPRPGQDGRATGGQRRAAATAEPSGIEIQLTPRTLGLVAGALGVVAVIAIGLVLLLGSGSAVRNISVADLRAELAHKDFTLLNVKTPYIGEISGTDLYIPYTELSARASELPANKAAKIVVYCRSGAESAIASQTLLNLGYTNIENLDGGMNAWTASGRSLVQKNRT